MSDPRARVLEDIRRSLKRRSPLPASVTTHLDARLRAPTANLKPALPGDPVECFVDKVQSVSGRIIRVASLAEVSNALLLELERHGVPLEIVVAPDPSLADIAWSNRLVIERRAACGDDLVSVTGAFAGIAETGTVVLLSGADSPTTLNFLPDYHFVVLRRSRIVPHIEDAWVSLRAERSGMPRTVNLITGPSKTGDVDQVIHEGAHGPRALHVMLIED